MPAIKAMGGRRNYRLPQGDTVCNHIQEAAYADPQEKEDYSQRYFHRIPSLRLLRHPHRRIKHINYLLGGSLI